MAVAPNVTPLSRAGGSEDLWRASREQGAANSWANFDREQLSPSPDLLADMAKRVPVMLCPAGISRHCGECGQGRHAKWFVYSLLVFGDCQVPRFETV